MSYALKVPIYLARAGMRRVAMPTVRIPSRSVSIFNFTSGKQEIEAANAQEMYDKVKEFHEKVLSPLNTKFLGPLEKASEQMIPLPTVFILGNHSSGKSSFINYLVGQNVQATGVAPTDDGFTIIAPGAADADQDGPSVIGDPSLGFKGLRQYGNGLTNKLQLKIRKNNALDNVMLIDTPGMIDSPVNLGSSHDSKSKDRGYDFSSVIRWFAERADIILLFQDPGKPGTTGETLHIMTTALKGQDYKTFIIMNKADQFATVLDFARSYGALCWNLSKVIPRKDIPRIYTMCIPVANPSGESGLKQVGSLKDALPDLEAARNEIVAEVKAAPLRRVDNLVTRLHDSAQLLRLHAVVLNAVKREYMTEALKVYGMIGAGSLGVGTLAATLLLSGLWEIGAPLGSLTVAATAIASWYARKYMGEKVDYYIDGPGLEDVFRRVHYMQLAEKDEYVVQLWDLVQPKLRSCLMTLGFSKAPSARKSDLQALDDIIHIQVPALRTLATKAGALQKAEKVAATAPAPRKEPA